MSFKRYSGTFDSGIEGLNKLPTGWAISRLGRISWIRARLGWKGLKAEEYVESGYALLATPNIKGASIDFVNTNQISQFRYDESPEIKISVGDVLLAKDGSTLGTVNIVRELSRPSTVNSSIAVITPLPVLSGIFLFYLFQCNYLKQLIELKKGGMGVPHLFQEDINLFEVPCPSIEEQTRISKFLDHETAKIDTLISEQENLITLLQEKRQALISHAVTKGLDSNVSMKDSGIEWLGQVPSHWQLLPLKRDLQFLTSGSRGWAENYSDVGALFLRIGNLTRDNISLDLSDIQRVEVPADREAERTRVISGDVLVSITAYLGSIAVVPEGIESAYVSQHIALARLKKNKITPKWLGYVVLSNVGKTYLASQSYGGTKIQLSLEDVANIIVPTPSIQEQIRIVSFLDGEIMSYDLLISESERAIALLKERRSALISAAVTGKIDVRGLVPA